jgi:hypothetical protein
MSDVAPDPGTDETSASRSLAARDAAGVLLGLASVLRHRSFDDAEVDPNLVETTVRRLRRVGTELLGSDDGDDDGPEAPPDGVAWATQLSWLLAHGRSEHPVSTSLTSADLG